LIRKSKVTRTLRVGGSLISDGKTCSSPVSLPAAGRLKAETARAGSIRPCSPAGPSRYAREPGSESRTYELPAIHILLELSFLALVLWAHVCACASKQDRVIECSRVFLVMYQASPNSSLSLSRPSRLQLPRHRSAPNGIPIAAPTSRNRLPTSSVLNLAARLPS
jgi:hypothetical protein